MKPIDFHGTTVIVAKDQPPYEPLPVQFIGGDMGVMVSCWSLSEEEIAEVIRSKCIWVTGLTFNQPVQPLMLSADRPQHAPKPVGVWKQRPADPKPRSEQWPHVRRLHLLLEPCCQWCSGTEDLEVHHMMPFHLNPALELEPTNLVTLCETPGTHCHLHIGHLDDWHKFNADIKARLASHRAIPPQA